MNDEYSVFLSFPSFSKPEEASGELLSSWEGLQNQVRSLLLQGPFKKKVSGSGNLEKPVGGTLESKETFYRGFV